MIRVFNLKYPCSRCAWFHGNGKCEEYNDCLLCPHRRNDECVCNQKIPEGETECPYYEEAEK